MTQRSKVTIGKDTFFPRGKDPNESAASLFSTAAINSFLLYDKFTTSLGIFATMQKAILKLSLVIVKRAGAHFEFIVFARAFRAAHRLD